jgi:isopentenyl-diphosphate Delta-isomerase
MMPAPSQNDLIDRVDEHDNVVGKVRRGDALRGHTGFRVVHVLVVGLDHRVLLQQVGQDGTRSPGKWGASIAGYLHAGETPLDGAARRLREELSVTANLDFCGRTRMRDAGSTKFIYVYVARTAAVPKIVDPGHVAALRYWNADDLDRAVQEEPDAFTPTFPLVLDVARPSL